uniref:Uncharacterized protein n=1 Tax=Knipowitschia caucasica TaxID=637954 RepID=A0AAV2IY99_KNICA
MIQMISNKQSWHRSRGAAPEPRTRQSPEHARAQNTPEPRTRQSPEHARAQNTTEPRTRQSADQSTDYETHGAAANVMIAS